MGRPINAGNLAHLGRSRRNSSRDVESGAMSRPRSARLVVASLVVVTLFPLIAQEKPPADAYARAHYTKHEFSIPMRDGMKLFTSVYVPKDRSTTYPIMLIRTPYSVGAVRRRPVPPHPRALRALHEGRLHLRLPGRARALHVGRRVRGRAAAQPGQERAHGHRRKHRHVRHHRLAGQERPGQQRQGRDVGHLVSGLLRSAGHDRRAPGAEGRLAAGAGHRLVPRRRLASQRRVPARAHSASMCSFGAAARRAHAATDTDRRSTTGTPDGYEFYLQHGAARERRTRNICKGAKPHSGTSHGAPQLRRVLAGAVHPAAPQGHQAGGDDRRRLVRRRGPVQGPLRTYQTIEQTSPGATNTLVMGPWTHGGWSRGAGDKLGPVTFGAKTSEFYREHVEFPFFAST